MTKFFISQPINVKSDQEIKAERDECIGWLAEAFGGSEVIDTFFLDEPPKDCNVPVWYLSKSLEALSKADVLVMWGKWQSARGCLIEREVATRYGIPVIVKGN